MIGVGSNIMSSYHWGVSQPMMPVTAQLHPASSPLVVGQSLNDTANWSTFLNTSNYTTSAPNEVIDTLAVNYIGDTSDAATAFTDGQINNFSITVTDTGGNSRTFNVQSRAVTYAAPTITSVIDPVAILEGLGFDTIDVAGSFSGDNLSWSVTGPAGVTISALGVVQVDTNSVPVDFYNVTVTASNSGGSVDGALSLEILANSLSIDGLTAGAAEVDSFPTISGILANNQVPDTIKWGSTLGGTEYGTSTNPTQPAPGTGGILYLEFTQAGKTYTASAAVTDIPAFTTQPTLDASTYEIGDTITLTEGVAAPSGRDKQMAEHLGFLHTFYYQTLSASDARNVA